MREVVASGERMGYRGGLGWLGWIPGESQIGFEFQWILEFGKSLRICTKRFRSYLDMGIFPKFF
jgi:hypothetical protein